MRHMFNIRNYCINCGVEIDYRAIRCRVCSFKNEGRSQKISNALKGKKHSMEIRRKMSESQKKNLQHLEFIIKMNKARKGISLSKEHRRKLSESHKGFKPSEEHLRKFLEASKEWHKNNPHPCLGKKLSEEHKRKIGIKSIGRKFSPRSKESRQRTSNALKNPSEETRKRFSESKRGYKNPNWQGGISFEPYGVDFNDELKEQIRERDDYTCQIPGCRKRENGRKHPVHHIDYNKNNNNSNNLISLCKSCHAKTGFDRNNWTNHFQSKIGTG